MGVTILNMDADKRKPLDWFDTLEKSFGIREDEEEQYTSQEEIKEDAPGDSSTEKCFYCNRPLFKEEKRWFRRRQVCAECRREAIISKEEAEAVINRCLGVLKKAYKIDPWAKESVKIKKWYSNKTVAIRVSKFKLWRFRKNKSDLGKKKLILKVWRKTPRLRVATDIFEWHYAREENPPESTVTKFVVNCLSAMEELAYADRYAIYHQKKEEGEDSVRQAEDS